MKNKKTVSGKRTHRRVQSWDSDTSRYRFYERGIPRSQQEHEFKALRRSLFKQHSPTTPLQKIAMYSVVFCSWRLRLAVCRLEAELLQALGKPNGELQDGSKSDPPSMSPWYYAGPRAARDGIRFLTECKETLEENGRLSEEQKEGLRKGFGEEYLAALTKWTPVNWDAVLLAHHMVEHSKRYGSPPPERFGSPPPDVRKDGCRAILDPTQSREMVGKLLDEKIRHLQDLAQIVHLKVSVLASVTSNPAAVAADSYRSAMQDLQGAVRWFKWLKRMNL